MRIGYFTSDFPYKAPFSSCIGKEDRVVLGGGVGEVVFQLALRMAARGHEIVIHTTSGSHHDQMERHGAITLIRYGRDLSLAHTEISLRYMRNPSGIPLDIVHLHAGSPPATLSALAYLKRHPVPFVITHHLDPDPYGGPLRRFLVEVYARYFLERAFAKSRCIIGLSSEFVRSSPYLSRHTDKIRIMPNGIDTKPFSLVPAREVCKGRLQLPPADPVILFLGRLVERKGPHILMEAMPAVLAEIPSARAVFAGPPTAFCARLDQLCREQGIEDRVMFTGFVPEEEKPYLYRAADVFVCPSFAEAFPLVLLEAAASGLPLITSDLDVFQALIQDGENGTFFRRGDPKELAEKIIYLLKHETIRKAMGQESKAIAGKHSWDAIVSRTEELYRELVLS